MMRCLECLCATCANNVDSEHTMEEIEFFCYHCDEAQANTQCHVDTCLMHKPTIRSIEQKAKSRRKQMRLVRKEQS